MNDWDFQPPDKPKLGEDTSTHPTDRQIVLESTHLQNKRIALLITGSIAAMKAPLIARTLRRQGAEVIAFCF